MNTKFIITLLGVAAAVITIFAFVSGKDSLTDFRKEGGSGEIRENPRTKIYYFARITNGTQYEFSFQVFDDGEWKGWTLENRQRVNLGSTTPIQVKWNDGTRERTIDLPSEKVVNPTEHPDNYGTRFHFYRDRNGIIALEPLP